MLVGRCTADAQASVHSNGSFCKAVSQHEPLIVGFKLRSNNSHRNQGYANMIS